MVFIYSKFKCNVKRMIRFWFLTSIFLLRRQHKLYNIINFFSQLMVCYNIKFFLYKCWNKTYFGLWMPFFMLYRCFRCYVWVWYRSEAGCRQCVCMSKGGIRPRKCVRNGQSGGQLLQTETLHQGGRSGGKVNTSHHLTNIKKRFRQTSPFLWYSI